LKYRAGTVERIIASIALDSEIWFDFAHALSAFFDSIATKNVTRFFAIFAFFTAAKTLADFAIPIGYGIT
jgi:hypothetical protein